MKRLFLVLLVVLSIFAVSCGSDDDSGSKRGGSAVDSIWSILVVDDGGNDVKQEPIATASANNNKTECTYMGLVVECK